MKGVAYFLKYNLRSFMNTGLGVFQIVNSLEDNVKPIPSVRQFLTYSSFPEGVIKPESLSFLVEFLLRLYVILFLVIYYTEFLSPKIMYLTKLLQSNDNILFTIIIVVVR